MIQQQYFEKVRKYFDGDIDKTWSWFKQINSKFGMMSPLALVKLGREKKVMQAIDDALKNNEML